VESSSKDASRGVIIMCPPKGYVALTCRVRKRGQPCRPPPSSSQAADYVVGSEVQAVPPVVKVNVALQVQPEYQVSVLFRTAPI
jgi:hypothetical protein